VCFSCRSMELKNGRNERERERENSELTPLCRRTASLFSKPFPSIPWDWKQRCLSGQVQARSRWMGLHGLFHLFDCHTQWLDRHPESNERTWLKIYMCIWRMVWRGTCGNSMQEQDRKWGDVREVRNNKLLTMK